MNSILSYIRDFILTCPLLDGENVNVDYIGTNMTYSIDALPCDPVIKTYVDGGKQKQFQFAFTSKEQYDEDVRINIENSGFYEAFEEWLDEQSTLGRFPEMGEKQSPVRFETKNKGYLYDIEEVYAKYRIECRFIYTQEV